MKLLIVILTYNDSFYTIQAVNHCLNIKDIEYNILVIDNCSPDLNVYLTLKNRFENNEKIEIIRKDLNDGYSGGNNFGLRLAQARGYDYCWILNNDIIFDDYSFIIDDVEMLNNNYNISILGHKIFNKAKVDFIEVSNNSLLYNAILFFSKYYKNAPKVLSDRYKKKNRVSGCSLIIRISDLDDLGFFNSSFFMYGEEDDFCLRAWRKNRGVYEDVKSKICHFGSATYIDKSNIWIIQLLIRNKMLIFKEYNNFIKSVVYLLFFISILKVSISYFFDKKGFISMLYMKTFFYYAYKINFEKLTSDNLSADNQRIIRHK